EHLPLDGVAGSPDGGPAHLAHAQRRIEPQRAVEPNPEHHLREEVTARPAPRFPDAGIVHLPVFEDVIHNTEQNLPSRLGQLLPRLPRRVGGLDELAVDVELELLDGGVADPDGLRPTVALQLVEYKLGHAVLGVDRVHHLKLLRVTIMRGTDPAQEAIHLVLEPELMERVHEIRSEERRVGKECRCRWWRYQ